MNTIKRSNPCEFPVRIAQFGEGNFLRAFIDWMIQKLNQKTDFKSSVQIIQPLEKGMGDVINQQDGVYTLILRGMENGQVVEQTEVIESVKGCLNAYSDWQDVMAFFRTPDLRFVFSNTTEAGIEYKPEELTEGKTPTNFPAKVAVLMRERFNAGLPGLIFLPCELIDKNGIKLREAILQYAADWSFGSDFAQYIQNECIFCCTLVDRIVAGYPRTEAESICQKLGYQDNLLDCGEPFHFFVIEGPESVAEELPFEKAGLNVVFVKDQTPYRTRKVRFLNGAHTSSVLAAYLAGFDYVDEMVSDEVFSKYLKKILFEEIFVTVPLPENEKKQFAEAVLERFANPFAMHQLISISLNSVSKWKVRVLPSLMDYQKINGCLPRLLSYSLAALIAFYQNCGGTGCNRVNAYPVSDSPEIVKFFEELWAEKSNDTAAIAEAVLKKSDFWDMDLCEIPGLAESVANDLKQIKALGIRASLKGILG